MFKGTHYLKGNLRGKKELNLVRKQLIKLGKSGEEA